MPRLGVIDFFSNSKLNKTDQTWCQRFENTGWELGQCLGLEASKKDTETNEVIDICRGPLAFFLFLIFDLEKEVGYKISVIV